MSRAFKVQLPKSYSNVKDAKLVQKGSNVWVQLPANLVTDRKMCRKSVYMDDFNARNLYNSKYRHTKAKVNTRRSSCKVIEMNITITFVSIDCVLIVRCSGFISRNKYLTIWSFLSIIEHYHKFILVVMTYYLYFKSVNVGFIQSSRSLGSRLQCYR